MNSVKKILVAVDGSKHSERALQTALDIAEATNAPLSVLQVREFLDSQLAYYGGIARGERAGPPDPIDMKKFCPRLNETSVKWEAEDKIGHPADEICAKAKDGYDLVVVGSHGGSAISRFFLGSVSDRVVHHAGCSVMVVR